MLQRNAISRLCRIFIWSCLFSGAAPAYVLAGPSIPEDNHAAVIFAYFAVGDDLNPNINLQTAQFEEQIGEILRGGYKVKALPDILAAFKSGAELPDKTVALTFDGADRSVLDTALPRLIAAKLPFTIFIPAAGVDAAHPPYMTWDDLRNLKKTGLVTFGLMPSSYQSLSGESAGEIRRQLNTSLARIRAELKRDPQILAYPFGEYNENFKSIAKDTGLMGAVGQQSGVAHTSSDRFALPRFTQTERYGDLERFRMTASALPFPAQDISPGDSYLTGENAAIGFSVDDAMSGQLKSLSCFSSTDEKPDIQILNKRRVEIRFKAPFEDFRARINCTLPVTGSGDDVTRWRWLGMLYTRGDKDSAPPQEDYAAEETGLIP